MVKEVDFDQLFARGHAMSEKMETQNQANKPTNGFGMPQPPEVSVTITHVPHVPVTTAASATPFEVYSKEEAFKKSQKGSGIGYAEKVQSFLTDQQTIHAQHPFQGSQMETKPQSYNDQTDAMAPPAPEQSNFLTPIPPPRRHASPRASPRRKGPSPRPNPHADPNAAARAAEMVTEIREPTEDEIRVQKRHHSVIEASKSSMHDREVTKKAIPQWATGKSTSKSPENAQVGQGPANIRAKKQMTPQEFLNKIQEFVANAEMDSHFAQPVWPAMAKQSELPATRPVQRTQSLTRPSTMPSQPIDGTQSLPRHSSLDQMPGSSPRHSTISSPPVDQFQSSSSPRNSTVSSPPLEQIQTSSPRHSTVISPPTEQVQQRPRSPRHSTVSSPPLELIEPPMSQGTTTVVEGAPVGITITPQDENNFVPNLPHPTYAPKPREHSPYRNTAEAGFLDSAIGKPISNVSKVNDDIEKRRMQPSSGKSYLDKPSSSPDPFGTRVEMDIPPSPSDAVLAAQSILSSLRESIRANVTGPGAQNRYPGETDDVITLDLRQNQEKLEYLSIPSDYSHQGQPPQGMPPPQPAPMRQETYPRSGALPRPMQGVSPTRQETYPRGRGTSAPPQNESFAGVRSISPGYQQPAQQSPMGRGRSPNRSPRDRSPRTSFSLPDETKAVLFAPRGSFSMPSENEPPEEIQPADSHIPMQLKPDPLVGHEGSSASSRRISFTSPDYQPTIEQTDLYKKLQLGIDKLMQTEKFKDLKASRDQLNSADTQSYSHHLGRAEFGSLDRRKRNISIGGNPVSDPSGRPRDVSNERPASAMAKIGGSGGPRRSAYSSQPSRDSSLGRHDSRHDFDQDFS